LGRGLAEAFAFAGRDKDHAGARRGGTAFISGGRAPRMPSQHFQAALRPYREDKAIDPGALARLDQRKDVASSEPCGEPRATSATSHGRVAGSRGTFHQRPRDGGRRSVITVTRIIRARQGVEFDAPTPDLVGFVLQDRLQHRGLPMVASLSSSSRLETISQRTAAYRAIGWYGSEISSPMRRSLRSPVSAERIIRST